MREGEGKGKNERIALVLLALTLVGFLALFVSKPVHIDDTVFLETARFLTVHPLQPFGARLNWGGVERSIFYEDNPFLLPYYFAAIIKLFGESEKILHVSYWIFPLACLFSLYGIAKRTGSDPLLGTALLVLSPAFLVSSTTLMADVPLLALYLVSCYFYLRFCESEKTKDGLLFAFFISLCWFTKYIGLTLIPLFLADSWQRGLARKTAVYLVLPIFLFLLWCVHNKITFGAIHFFEAGQSMNFQTRYVLEKAVASVSFTGLCVLSFAIFGNWRTKSDAIFWMSVCLMFSAIITFFHVTHSSANTFLLAIGIAGALSSFIKIFRPDSDRFLLLWFSGMLLYSWFSEFIAARVVLFFAPPLLLLLSRRSVFKTTIFCLILNLVLSFAVARADQEIAYLYKNFGETFPTERMHYIAHWGLQYYFQKRGLQPFDYERDRLQKGDLIIVPQVAGTSFYPLPAGNGPYRGAMLRLVYSNAYNFHLGVFVMNQNLDAGWYCHGWGILPFSISYGRLENVNIYQVTEADIKNWEN